MTEHDDPTNEDPITSEGPNNAGPTGERPADDDAAWFRAQVDPVIGGEVPDAWEEIQSRATGRQPMLIPLPQVATRAWPGRRLVAVAALLLVAVGVVGLGMKLVGSDDDQRPAVGEDDGATGFYIPGTLPEGWELTGLSTGSTPGERAGLACPCTTVEVASDDGDGGYRTVSSAGSPAGLGGSTGAMPDQSDGRSGGDGGPSGIRTWYGDPGGIPTVAWRTAAGSRSIESSSLKRDELEALAQAWTSDEPPVLDEHHVAGTWTREQPVESLHDVLWSFTDAENGQNLDVMMGPKMLGSGILATTSVTLPGNGLPLGIMPEGALAATWPGNTGLFAMPLTGQPPDQAIIEAILGSFQPADAATWADYLESASLLGADAEGEPQNFDALRTQRISSWLQGPEPGADLPQRKVLVTPGLPYEVEGKLIVPSAAITVESDVDFVTVATGESFTIELTMTNRTGTTVDVSGCAFGGVTWSIIDEQGLVTPAGSMDVFCDAGLQPWPDSEQRTQTFEFPGLGSMPDEGPIAAVIQYGDNLSQGVTVVVPGEVGG